MPLTPEVLTAQGEVVAWLGSLDVSFAAEEEPWFTIDGVESPRQIGSDGSGAFVLLPSQRCASTSHRKGPRRNCVKSPDNFDALHPARCRPTPIWLDILKFSAGGDLADDAARGGCAGWRHGTRRG